MLSHPNIIFESALFDLSGHLPYHRANWAPKDLTFYATAWFAVSPIFQFCPRFSSSSWGVLHCWYGTHPPKQFALNTENTGNVVNTENTGLIYRQKWGKASARCPSWWNVGGGGICLSSNVTHCWFVKFSLPSWITVCQKHRCSLYRTSVLQNQTKPKPHQFKAWV